MLGSILPKVPSSPGADIRGELRVSMFALLEMYRRSQWNVIRLENEHYNNCGMFRAVALIPTDDIALM